MNLKLLAAIYAAAIATQGCSFEKISSNVSVTSSTCGTKTKETTIVKNGVKTHTKHTTDIPCNVVPEVRINS